MEDHVVIIGNGISGITAARNIRKKSKRPITIISSETEYFFSRTALMYIYMGHMRFKDTQPYEAHFWEKNNLNLVFDKVNKVDTDNKTLILDAKGEFKFDQLILATGSKSNIFPWPGVEHEGVQGLYSAQDLESLENRSEAIDTAVIVGGGLIGIELAEMLLSRDKKVIMLVRENRFWSNILPKADAEFVTNHIALHHNLTVRYETEMDTIEADSEGTVNAITTKSGETIKCEFVGLTVGVTPNIDFLKDSNIELGRGILVDPYLETSVKGIYAIGDCAERREAVGRRRNLEQVWYTGKIMGETVANTICGKPMTYDPGNWFNSAKFMDLEYQTYGWVFADLGENEEELIYEDVLNSRLIHFVFEKESHQFIGVNTFGIRLRHEVFDAWLNEKKDMSFVLSHFSSANFDPEFFKKFEIKLVDAYNAKFNKNIRLHSRQWWTKILN